MSPLNARSMTGFYFFFFNQKSNNSTGEKARKGFKAIRIAGFYQVEMGFPLWALSMH